MGGSAFAAGASPLYTPRMPKAIYQAVKSQCHAVLRDYYDRVASPIDGPGKEDFGDVDILLACPKHSPASREDTLNELSKTLGAVSMIADKGKDISGHLAIPWPDEGNLAPLESSRSSGPQVGQQDDLTHGLSNRKSQKPTSSAPDVHESPEQGQELKRFIQVDVRVCETVDQLEWMLFKHAHGDIWNLLGTTIRPYGLTVDETALWLRIPEIEDHHRNRAKVFLSSNPVEILRFLGLPIQEYWETPFPDLTAMFEYASLCRMFWIRPLDPEEETNSLEQDRKKLKANDRKRMNQRPGFRKWVEEYKPRCREEGRFLVKPATREAITQEALDWFHVEPEYTSRRDEFLLEKQKDMIWRDVIKGSLPAVDSSDPRAINYRSCLVKALKRIILEDDDRYGILPDPTLRDDGGFYVVENVLDFIVRRQDEIGNIAWGLNQQQYAESRKRKSSQDSGKTPSE